MRTTIISTSKLRNYKRFIFILDAGILVCLVVFLFYIHSIEGKWHGYFLPIIIYLQFHMFYPMFLKLKNVSYDDSSIYYSKEGYEIQVPFEDILSIELRSVTGIYGIKLINPSQGEKEIYFKTSAWYPFNFQKKDEVVDELRQKINRHKRTLPEQNFSALPSYRL
jgi:hypothetical protein